MVDPEPIMDLFGRHDRRICRMGVNARLAAESPKAPDDEVKPP